MLYLPFVYFCVYPYKRHNQRSLFRGWFVEDDFADEVDCLDGFVEGESAGGG